MSEHDAQYLRKRHRTLECSESRPFSIPKCVKRGFELRRPDQVFWPRNKTASNSKTVAWHFGPEAPCIGAFPDCGPT